VLRGTPRNFQVSETHHEVIRGDRGPVASSNYLCSVSLEFYFRGCGMSRQRQVEFDVLSLSPHIAFPGNTSNIQGAPRCISLYPSHAVQPTRTERGDGVLGLQCAGAVFASEVTRPFDLDPEDVPTEIAFHLKEKKAVRLSAWTSLRSLDKALEEGLGVRLTSFVPEGFILRPLGSNETRFLHPRPR
jgi:hypothetical protein